jgi:hypothetical protein
MVKFIIEVEEEYIREKASGANLKKMSDEGKDPLLALFNIAACGAIEKEVDKGIKEFTISPKTFDDSDKNLFDHCIPEIFMLSIKTNKTDKKKK